MSRVVSKKKPCCKICKDSGKSESVFSSHWPKDNAGKVICPTLLSQPCRYCAVPGHTVSYCAKLQKDNALRSKMSRDMTRADARQSVSKPKPKPMEAPSGSRFHLLIEDDSDESPKSPKKKTLDEYPALPSVNPTAISQRGTSMGFCEAVSRSLQYTQSEKSGLCDLRTKRSELSQRERDAALHRHECFKGLNGKSWADLDSDSDDE